MSGSGHDDLESAATEVQTRGPRGVAAFRVRVTGGPDRGAEVTSDGAQPGPVLIGQSPACGLRLTDAAVSRRHAELDVSGSELRIRDLGSTNGTFVNDVSVLEAKLFGGEEIRMGSTVLFVERVVAGSTSTQTWPDAFQRFLGRSAEVKRLYPLVERLSAAAIPVVIEGETGTGKEVLAEAMHEAGPRRAGPYVVFDCTAVPANLVEAELFGHDKGAFTGATMARRGVFEQAHGGTLLIDEVGDLDVALQPKLLRAIERSEIRPLGADAWRKVDVRVIAATRRDLDREVQEGRFRDDLFHRLSVARIALPPLRQRSGDVPFLAQAFWTQLGGAGAVPQTLLERWRGETWPGNVRELRNRIARHLALGDVEVRPAYDAADSIAPPSSEAGTSDFIATVIDRGLPLPLGRMHVVEEFERRYIARVLAEHDGSIARAAAASGIGRRYFQMIRGRLGKRRGG